MSRTVVSKGTGRADYSEDIETSTVPIIRSFQANATHYETFTLTAGETLIRELSLTFSADSLNHFIFHYNASVDANVLISIKIESGGFTFGTYYGYQHISVDIPQGIGFSDITLTIVNYGDISVNGAYFHNGVQGTEKIMPTPSVG